MQRRALWAYLLALAVFTTGLMGAALLVSGGWEPLLELGPGRMATTTAAVTVAPKLSRGSTVLWMGDSVCIARADWDPADLRVPSLGALMEERLGGGQGLLGPGWKVEQLCEAGASGLTFESQAQALVRLGRVPPLAVIPVNLRSLNALGSNGFIPPARFSQDKTKERGGLRRGFDIPGLGKLREPVVAAAILGRGVLQTLLEPKPIPKEAQASGGQDQGPGKAAASPQEAAAGTDRIYGAGYALDPLVLQGLLGAGALLRQNGCRVFYYLTPLERSKVSAQVGPQLLQQRDRAAQQVLRTLMSEGFEVLDLQAALNEGFIEAPSEHLGAGARVWLADKVAAWIVQRLKAKPMPSPARPNT